MNVLSLFDGISCGQVALNRAGIKYDKYFASEIDKYAITIAQKNFPETIQLGDICNIKADDLPKIDLIMGGSPCHGFSLAGKQLNFDDPRSKLFFEFVRLKNELMPKYFLLENVPMKQEYINVISEQLGCSPVCINSALVSAQNRERLYWTNIPGDKKTLFENEISQPDDRHIYLKDIIEDGCVDKDKRNLKSYFEYNRRQIPFDGLIHIGEADLNCNEDRKRVYDVLGKSQTLTAVCGGNQEAKIALDTKYWRKLTPVEYERLQTLDTGYTEGVSNTRRYHALGNGWTVDVIVHILRGINN